MTKIPILCPPFLLAGCALSPPNRRNRQRNRRKASSEERKVSASCDTMADSEAPVAVKRSSKNIVEFTAHDEKA